VCEKNRAQLGEKGVGNHEGVLESVKKQVSVGGARGGVLLSNEKQHVWPCAKKTEETCRGVGIQAMKRNFGGGVDFVFFVLGQSERSPHGTGGWKGVQ